MPTDYSKLRKFNSCQEVKDLVEVYFKRQKEERRPFIIVGLARALGTNRQTLLDYEKEEKSSLSEEESKCISDTIKESKLRCEEYAEEALFIGKNVIGPIFNLKNNYKWKDKTEMGFDSPITEIEIIVKNKDEIKVGRGQGHNKSIPQKSDRVPNEGKEDNNKRGRDGKLKDGKSIPVDGDDNVEGEGEADNDSQKNLTGSKGDSDEGLPESPKEGGSI